MLLGPSSRGSLLLIHKASFVVWIGVTAVHVFGHLQDLPRALSAKYRDRTAVAKQGNRRAGGYCSLDGVLIAGLMLAIPYIPSSGPWLHAHH